MNTFPTGNRVVMPARFLLMRTRDVSSVSGTGIVAAGVLFPGGKVVLHWLVEPYALGYYDSLDDLLAVHGHNGLTTVQWLDKVWCMEKE